MSVYQSFPQLIGYFKGYKTCNANNLFKIFMEILDYKSTCLNKNRLQEYNDVSVFFYSLYVDCLFRFSFAHSLPL